MDKSPSSTNNFSDMEALLPLYALGGLSAAEMAQVEAFLAQHPEKQAEVEAMSDAASLLAEAVPDLEPPSHVKTAVIGHVQRSAVKEVSSRPKVISTDLSSSKKGWVSRFSVFRPLVALASVGAMAVLALSVVQVVSLQRQMDTLQGQNTALSQSLVDQGWLVSYLLDDEVDKFSIAGTEGSPGSSGQLLLRENGADGILLVSDLSPLAADQTYQFWAINSETAVDAGLFTIGEDGIGILRVDLDEPIENFEAIGVSIEPAGGSSEPTGEIVMLSELEQNTGR